MQLGKEQQLVSPFALPSMRSAPTSMPLGSTHIIAGEYHRPKYFVEQEG